MTTEIGNTLRGLRGKKDISQEKLAEISGVSRATIARIETGSIDGTRSTTLVKLAEALGVTAARLFRVSPPGKDSE